MKTILFFLLCQLFFLVPLHAFELSAEDEQFLDMVQRQTFNYFIDCMDQRTGLVMDRADNRSGSDFTYAPATIAGSGFGLSSLVVGVERGWISREKAETITLNNLKYAFDTLEHKNGFFYHFMDMNTGKRVWNCEISSIDTALFMAGVLLSAEYYENPQIRGLAEKLYDRIDWKWMTDSSDFLCMGWRPETGFIPHFWKDYSECMILYVMAMGASRNDLNPSSWRHLNRTAGVYGNHTLISCPPLFTHQYSHIWIDFKDKNDGFADYFHNSVQATLANRQFCLDSSPSYSTYGENCWGLTACIGPDGYTAYGAMPGPAVSDGTVAPTAAGGSLVFTPMESLGVLKFLFGHYKKEMWGKYGFSDSLNTCRNWFAGDAYAINQGPIVLMIENLRTGLIWNLFMKNRYIQKGMDLAGFRSSEDFKLNLLNLRVERAKPCLPHLRPSQESRRVSDDLTFETFEIERQVSAPSSGSPLTLKQEDLQSGTNGQEKYETEALFFHNSRFLFICGKVLDRDIVTTHGREEMHLDDAIEIYIDGQNDNFKWGGSRDYQIVVSPDTVERKLRVSETFSKGELTPELRARYKELPDNSGYSFLLGVPRKPFSIEGETIGFNIVTHNVDKNGLSDCKLSWFYAEPGIILGNLVMK